ncbi:hypothetical protein AB3M83_03890 [Microbacterium sp. 179-B 1A2 NHS]|uniref:hypothetical protein n=1 Tax=Microbacterium sp. 179-B 1A2 NHS TaxID=3142383 RepID=UPI0039A2F397
MSSIGTVEDDRGAVLDALVSAAHPDDTFLARLDEHFPDLHAAAADAHVGTEQLQAMVVAASAAWSSRSLDLKVHGQRRAAGNVLASPATLGASCFADRFAGNLAGLRDEIPYLRELGVTLLHVQSPFATADDGTPDLRRIDPGLGRLDRLSDVAAALRLAGIALAVDVDVAGSGDPVALVTDLFFLANHGVEAFLVADRAVAALLDPLLAVATPGVAVLPEPSGSTELWRSLATADAGPLQRAVEARDGSLTVTAVRDADALRWADEDDADRLTAFYTDGSSFGRGVPVAGGVAGTTASLAGIEAGDPLGESRVVLAHALALSLPGVPLLWLGDDVAQLNDPTSSDDPGRRDDPRWIHRGQKPRDRYAQRTDAGTPAGRTFAALTKLIAVRQATPEFGGTRVIGFDVPQPSIVGYQRPGDVALVLVLGNVATTPAPVDADTLSGFMAIAHDLVDDVEVDLSGGLVLPPCGFRWVRVTPRA